jgi:putative ABC transport system permease protein
VRSATRVALIGQTTAENLFEADENPVGKTIRIRQTPFTIIGTLAPKGQNLDGRDQDDDFFIRNLAAAADSAAKRRTSCRCCSAPSRPFRSSSAARCSSMR